jgi:meiotic recombination protein REC8
MTHVIDSRQHSNQLDIDWQTIDDGYDLPPAAPGPSSDQYRPQEHRSSSVLESSSSANAPQRRKRCPKPITVDSKIELRNKELMAMNTDYLVNMANDQARTYALRANQQAKRNSIYWLLGRGLGNIGSGIGNSKTKGPLAEVFSGTALYQWITGIPLGVTGQKRESEDEETTDIERQKRRRLNEEDQVGRAGPAYMDNNDSILQGDGTELARDQPEALEYITSAMPWNILSSIRGSSANRAQTGAAGSITGSFSRRGNRLVSASPLVGRGRPSGLENFGEPDPNSDAAMLGSMEDFGGLIGDEEFEYHGPGARVDTKTAAQNSWQTASLDQECNNFYDFIENAITEKRKAAEALDLLTSDIKVVEFKELLDPAINSVIVASQALLHVLTLGTKNLISVQQKQPYGPIQLRLLEDL